MRVLHVISSINSESGGPSAALLGLAMAQQRIGLSVQVVSTFRPGQDNSAASTMRASGVGVELIGPAPGRLARHPGTQPALEKAIAGSNVVHIHALWEDIQHLAASVARRREVPYVFRPCGMLDPWSLSQNRWMKKLYLTWRLRRDLNGAAAIHYTADAERDGAAALKLRPPGIVEPNGVDLEAYRDLPARGAFRHRFGIDPQRPLLLFLSRIHPKKGLDLLIPAFAEVVANDQPGEGPLLALVGPDHDGYRVTVERLIAQHGVADRVIWTGMLQGADKVQAYVDSDLFVLPSYQENFGIVVAEAMAAGLAVVISDKVNLDRDVLSAGAGGVVPLDAPRLASEIVTWLRNSVMRQRAARAARSFAFERFDWASIAARWADGYQKILSANTFDRAS